MKLQPCFLSGPSTSLKFSKNWMISRCSLWGDRGRLGLLNKYLFAILELLECSRGLLSLSDNLGGI